MSEATERADQPTASVSQNVMINILREKKKKKKTHPKTQRVLVS